MHVWCFIYAKVFAIMYLWDNSRLMFCNLNLWALSFTKSSSTSLQYLRAIKVLTVTLQFPMRGCFTLYSWLAILLLHCAPQQLSLCGLMFCLLSCNNKYTWPSLCMLHIYISDQFTQNMFCNILDDQHDRQFL